MPKTAREDKDNLTSVLTVTLERGEYESKFKTELEKYRKKAHMKGFRPGKTPMSVIKKMYGRAVLADVVNDMLQKELYRYLTEEDIEILGQPLPADEQEAISFDLKDLDDYEFRFDVGLAPGFEVQGVSDDEHYEKYVVDVPDEILHEELNNARKRLGERVLSEEDIQEGDLIKFSALELDGDKVKEDGVESEFTLLVSNIDDEEVKKEVLTKKKGDTLEVNLFELEKNVTEKYVRRHYLKLEEEDEREVGPRFKLTVEEVSRIEPAELNETFFNSYFGEGQVSNEAEALEKIRESIVAHYLTQADALLYRSFQERMMEKTSFELPDTFLKRWLKASNEEASDEVIANEYDAFAENLKWSLIKGKLTRSFDLEVSPEEVSEKFKDQVRGYFAQSGMDNEEFVNSMAARLMQDQKQYEKTYEDLMADKLFEAISEKVTIEEKPISLDAFKEVVEQIQLQDSQKAQLSSEEEE